ncbi:Protein dopey [Pichia kudriavzevii]|uniref:Protein dopey n=1 Tax=Pichia kudriavzevii TaxID=4909 RepID=A0A1V2LI48_PICKU|nr:Protein dopey [Pichia kudriavzevii]
MLSKCLAPSLPSGVHKKTIELYSNIFDILKETNLSQSITLWLPGIFPLMSYASISIKQDLLNLFSNYICNVEPIYLRSCFKSILLSLLPALDDTTSEFFNPTIDLIEKLKIQLDDVNHFWQCILLSIITSPDKRTGSMEYLTRKFPLFKVLGGTENLNKDIVLGELSLDAKACLTPNSSLLVRAFCRAISDDNLFVQRGFFDILLSRLPLNSAVFQYLINDDDKELLLLHVTSTVMKKDMSLNRRLWNWLLGPEPSVEENQSDITPRTLSRSEYFKKYGYQPILKTLKQLLLNDTDKPKSSGEITQDFITVCSISISIMDRWEIGQVLLPQLFVSILERSKHIFEHQPSDFEKIIKVSNELFDGVETNIIWANIFELIRNNQLDLVLFILRYYNVEDEEMLITHIPMVLLGSFAMFKLDIKWICLVETLIKMIPERALLPFELTQEEIDLNDEYKKSIVDNLNEYYSLDDTKTQSSPKRPYENLQLSSLYFTFITDIIIRCLDDKQSTVFLRSCKIFESFMQIVPSSKEISNLSMVKDLLMKMGREMENDVELSFGASTLFKSVSTIYKAWIVLQNEKNTLREVTNPSDGKTKRYWFSKVKFRCRKILEQEYLMEPLETIESLIENWKDSEWGQDDGFKLFQVLDDCQQKIILMYIIQGIISRVNYSSLEEDKRSNLICNLSEIELSNFLVSYITNLRDDENIEKSWNELQGFFKDVLSNVSYYKYIYPQLLEFVSIVSLKYLNTTVGSQKKASREIGDLFIRFLGNVLSIKLVPNSTHSFSRAILHGSLEVNDKEEKDKVETDGNLKEKIVFRQEVCSSLRNVIPSMKILINDDDKLVSAFTNIITCVSTFMNKSGGINFKVPEYFIDLLLQLGADETCKDLKAWKNLCYEILNDGKLFINEEVLEREKWDSVLQTWIRNDDSRLRDLIVHKQTINMNKGNSGILFNWNDEVAVLNGNIEYIKKITYLLLINEKDTFLNLINDLLIRIDGYLRTFQNLSKHCEAEIWIFILIRCIVVKFSENHLIESWTMINSSIFQILSEGYQKIVQVKDCGNVLVELEVEEEDENVGVFNQVFLEACKLLDILVVINYEEFQLSEWVFICDNMDGIYNNPGQQVGILEKLSKNSVLISGSGELTIDNKGVPMLKNIVKIKSLIDMKRFFGMLKIEKFENDYEMRDIKYDAITQDILHDLLSI